VYPLTPEQTALQAAARELAQGEFAATAAHTDATEAYPWDNIAKLRDAGFMGMMIPKSHGGRGLSHLDTGIVIEEMAQACAAMGRITVDSNLGVIGAVMAYGTDEQKKIAAECVLAGDKPAICISEPNAGSAASEMTTRADRQGDHYRINGHKYWITGGGVSRLHLVFARVFDDGVEQGIAGFIVVRRDASDPAAMQVADDPEPKQHPLERSADVEARRGVVHPRGVGPPVRTEVEAEEPLHLAQWRVDETW